MKRSFYAFVAVIALVRLADPAAAQDFGKALEAAQRGDYETALAVWSPPLAEAAR